MATYYLWDGAAGAATGADWTNAFTTLTAALAAATASGDIIKVHKAHTDDIAADTTWTMQNNLRIICVDKDNSDALAEMDGSTGYFGNTTTSYSIILAGAYHCFLYGLCFLISGTGSKQLKASDTDGHSYVFEKCKLWHKSSSTNVANVINIGKWGSSANSADRLIDCNLWFGHSSHSLRSQGENTFINCTVNSSGAAPTAFMTFDNGSPGGGTTIFNGCDLSHITGTLCPNTAVFPYQYFFINCKLGAAVTVLASQTAVGESGNQATVINSSSGDENYVFAHYNRLGTTLVDTGIYVADGAGYNETGTKYSWKIVTSADCSVYTPYTTPWIHTHNETLTAITPWLECMRDNSSGAVFQNDEVWAELSYQGTTGFPQAVFVNDRMTILGSAADQTSSSKTASDWTGETGTPGFFKIGPAASITPAEIGPLSARVCVGEPSITVYVDPQIRT